MKPASSGLLTHSPPVENFALLAADLPLQQAVAANGAARENEGLAAFGRRWGSADMFEQGRLANDNPPRLVTFDARGRRRDAVEFHPPYHRLMEESISAGVHAATWEASGTRAPAAAQPHRAHPFPL